MICIPHLYTRDLHGPWPPRAASVSNADDFALSSFRKRSAPRRLGAAISIVESSCVFRVPSTQDPSSEIGLQTADIGDTFSSAIFDNLAHGIAPEAVAFSRSMKLAWMLTACLGCSQAVQPAVGNTQSPCPTEAARPEASTQPIEAAAPTTLEPAKDAAPAPAELEGLPAPELDGTIAFTEFNESLDRTQPAWQSDPTLVVARALDTAGEAHTTISIELFHESKRTVDGANVAKATITRDGFLDDSIRGTRYRLELRLDPDRKAWRIFSASADWRCWRGHADYSTALCQ